MKGGVRCVRAAMVGEILPELLRLRCTCARERTAEDRRPTLRLWLQRSRHAFVTRIPPVVCIRGRGETCVEWHSGARLHLLLRRALGAVSAHFNRSLQPVQLPVPATKHHTTSPQASVTCNEATHVSKASASSSASALRTALLAGPPPPPR